MRQKSKNYSVVIMSDALTSSKEFVVSKKLIRNALIAVSLLILVFGFVVFDYLTKYISISMDNKENIVLKQERKTNLEQIASLTKDLKLYESRFNNMKKKVDKFMVIAGLTSAYKIEDMGVGGSTPALLSEVNTSIINTESIKNKSDLIDSNKINKDSIRTEKDLGFILNVIKDKKKHLAATPSIWPSKGYIASTFGYRTHPFTGKRDFHNGLDISSQLGNDVLATGGGFVVIAEPRGFLGKMIIIDHGYGYTTRYGHLADFNVKEGDVVKRGQVIGYIGNTGRSTGPHLHYEVRLHGIAHNPLDFILD